MPVNTKGGRDEATALVKQGLCACPECEGGLTVADLRSGGWGECLTCRCSWKFEEIGGLSYLTRIAGLLHPRS
jgi:hypothetical protein